jgi:uncharacterized protein (DUF1778 family)
MGRSAGGAGSGCTIVRWVGSFSLIALSVQLPYNLSMDTPTLIPADKTRDARLEARLSSDQKNLFQQAADLSGRTLSEFVVDSAQQAAVKIVREHEAVRLSREEQIAFVTALLDPPKLGARLRKAAKNYHNRQKAGA